MIDQAVHEKLMQPATYPDHPSQVTFLETHVSRLYLTDRHVYKIKKPVDFKFLNFSSLDRRRFYCQEEVRLNSRYAPGIYLGVVEIRDDQGMISIGGAGKTREYAVWMKRLPADRMLDSLIDRRAPELPHEVIHLGRLLASLEESAPICRQDGGVSNLETVRKNWRENFDQIAPYMGDTLLSDAHNVCWNFVDTFLQDQAEMFLQREQEGFVREGHGDLHAEHICMTDPICIYDCIEFNRRFRVADIAADLAFLLMDLDFRERRDLSEDLLENYNANSSASLQIPELLTFYKMYRAFVRGKVESFLFGDPDAPPAVRQLAQKRARQYFSLCLGYLMPPSLILTCGMMGSGKTTLAKEIARATGCRHLRSDVVRKELAGLEATTPVAETYGTGIYTSEWSRRTYEALGEMARESLSKGLSVVVDACFGKKTERDAFIEIARDLNVRTQILYLQCDTAELLNRLEKRQADRAEASDGRPELLKSQQAHFEKPGEEEMALVLDGAKDPCLNTQAALAIP